MYKFKCVYMHTCIYMYIHTNKHVLFFWWLHQSVLHPRMRWSAASRCVPRRRAFPQGPRRKNLTGWFLKTKSSRALGDRTKVHGNCSWRWGVAPECVNPVYIRLSLQLSLTLTCIKALSKTLLNIHGTSLVPAPCLTSPSTCLRRWRNFSTVPQGRFFFKNHPAKYFLRAI